VDEDDDDDGDTLADDSVGARTSTRRRCVVDAYPAYVDG
jgi:hypothetical protein